MSETKRRGHKLLLAAAISGLVSTTAQAEIKGTAIRIGVLTDMSGPFATAMGPGSVEAAKMAAEEFGGSINGKPIQILQAEQGNPELSLPKPEGVPSPAPAAASDGR